MSEQFEKDCKEFKEHAQMVMDYEGAFDKCLEFLSKFKAPVLDIQLMEKYDYSKHIVGLEEINWPMDKLGINEFYATMLNYFMKFDEFEKCALLEKSIKDNSLPKPDENSLHDFCYSVQVIYTFSANCEVCWEYYDAYESDNYNEGEIWGIYSTGIFSFDMYGGLSECDIDGLEFVTTLSNYFHDTKNYAACKKIKILIDGLKILLKRNEDEIKRFGRLRP
ncbi:MAG: hypothetical protein ACLQQ4_14535 [Bacteroidia bacterium]